MFISRDNSASCTTIRQVHWLIDWLVYTGEKNKT
jgi:hypothetical protein